MEKIILECRCPMCGQTAKIEVWDVDYYRYELNGGLVQDCFPYLTANEREAIITGICPECWERMFLLGEA